MNPYLGLLFSLPLISNVYLIPGGDNIAFELKTDGIIVTSTYDIKIGNTIYNPTVHSDINRGDIIKACEGYKVNSVDDFIKIFNNFINKGKIDLTLYRDNKKMHKTLRLIKDGDKIKTGLFVKERILGIGTISFYDEEKHIYGALAHEIYDDDSKSIVEFKEGTIYKSKVIGIKNNDDEIGEKIADTSLKNELGSILENSKFGIFGKIEEIPSTYKKMELGLMKDIHLGKAKIHTVTKDFKIEEYDVIITELKKQKNYDIKGIGFKIVDEDLLNISGGIYYGMSGSPLIQDNKLIGSVSHVLAKDKKKGYALYMEHMYNYALEKLNLN